MQYIKQENEQKSVNDFMVCTGLMGEANLRYARNEKQDAINLCMEVIRQVNEACKVFQCIIIVDFVCS